MFCVRVIGTLVVLMVLALTYLLMWEEDLGSFMKLLFIVWYTFISTECWIRCVHGSARTNVTILAKHWSCITLLGIFMGVCRVWDITEEDLAKASVITFTYYFIRLIMIVDCIDDRMNDMNEGYLDDEVANRNAYRQVLLDLIQQMQDQQEFQERMN